MPLVPPASVAVADVVDDVLFKILSTSKDMTQPDAAGHLINASPVMALPVTLKNILSKFPPFVLLNSVIGEQPPFAVVSVGPGFVSVTALAVSVITHNELTVPAVPHAYNSPVPSDEL
jgi:hypothetical protein